MLIHPVTLLGKSVRLEPLSVNHIPGLVAIAQDETIWKFMRYGPVTTEQEMEHSVRDLLEMQERGTALPFTVIHLADGAPAGMTRYMDIEPSNNALEIGGTWYGLRYQRTSVNTECKYLLLRHAFEDIGVNRVQFKTDLRNERSQHAIERIGAVREGVLREHIVLPDGHIRSSVYYSILAREWPSVRDRLRAMLDS